MSYPDAVRYLESFINYENKSVYPYKESIKLKRIKEFLKVIDNPQDTLKCIHVAGTKGKGSVCVFCAYILKEAGYKVGLYTSPHLSQVRERIRILNPAVTKSPACPGVGKYKTFLTTETSQGRVLSSPTSLANEVSCCLSGRQAAGRQNHKVSAQASPKGTRTRINEDFEGMISPKELESLVERLAPEIEEYNKNSKSGPLSFFEVYTALAFTYFKEKEVDFAVLETGLGGRLDATNVVYPLVSAITPISFDHTQQLGNTLREIATEKAGIIKVRQLASEPVSQSNRQTGKPANRQTSFVITAPQEREAIKVIRQRCKSKNAILYEIGKDINIIFKGEESRCFNIDGVFGRLTDLRVRLLGKHQVINATLAVANVLALNKFYQAQVSIEAIRNGLYNTVWPGRFEIVSRQPLVILDGAQNIASSRALKETIRENFSASGGKYKRLILVLGISKDKDIKGICQQFCDLADEVILTKANNSRATEPQNLADYFNSKPIYITQNVKEAKAQASRMAKKADLILITGSLFVVGEARELFYGPGKYKNFLDH